MKNNKRGAAVCAILVSVSSLVLAQDSPSVTVEEDRPSVTVEEGLRVRVHLLDIQVASLKARVSELEVELANVTLGSDREDVTPADRIGWVWNWAELDFVQSSPTESDNTGVVVK